MATAQSYRCTECGAVLRNHAEMQAHGKEFEHSSFEECVEALVVKYCVECGKPCNNPDMEKMHTRSTGHATFCLEAPKAAASEATPMVTDDVDDTFTKQALSVLPTEEALKEPGELDGDTKMIRTPDDTAVVYKWSSKTKEWTKHREVVDEEQPADPEECAKALALADPALLAQLKEMGFAESRSQKALMITGNDSCEHALQWLTERMEDPRADSPLSIAQVKAALKVKLTPEEKAAKAQELTVKARQRRKKREEQEALLKIKREREGAKQSMEQKRQFAEIERDAFIAEKKRERARDKAEKKKIQDKLAADRAERGFEGTEPVRKQPVPTARMRNALKEIKGAVSEEKKLVCFKTLLAYVGNILDNAGETKFRRIKRQNKAFLGRVVACGAAGPEFLSLCGFKEKDETFLVCEPEDDQTFKDDIIPRLKAAKRELVKSIENPFWL